MLERGLARTKILATLGPASGGPRRIRDMIRAGVDGFRLNMSHGDRETREGWVRMVREQADALERPVSLVVDLRGPRIRLGTLAEEVVLKRDREVLLAPGKRPARDGSLPVDYPRLLKDVRKGDRVLLRDGTVVLKILEVGDKRVRCRVKVGGPVGAHHGVNLPDSPVTAPALSVRDREDVRWAVEQGADWLALSFVRTADDLRSLRRALKRTGGDLPIIAKIEHPLAVENLDEILEESDAVMVARGDLAVEMGLAVVPTIQKRIVRAALEKCIPVIVATQMLESMIESSQPTRAEVSDVANAVLDGADVVMLSGETAIGAHPIEVCRTMSTIARRTEAAAFDGSWRLHRLRPRGLPGSPEQMACINAAVYAAHQADAALILAFTESGRTARLVSSFRASQPIVALTRDERTFRRMALYWGVRPGRLKPVEKVRDMNREAAALLREHRMLAADDLLVSLTGTFNVSGATNTIRILELNQLG